jgi:hypothetical protein
MNEAIFGKSSRPHAVLNTSFLLKKIMHVLNNHQKSLHARTPILNQRIPNVSLLSFAINLRFGKGIETKLKPVAACVDLLGGRDDNDTRCQDELISVCLCMSNEKAKLKQLW